MQEQCGSAIFTFSSGTMHLANGPFRFIDADCIQMNNSLATPIVARIAQPSPEEVRQARTQARLKQAEAAQLVSSAQGQPYRTWQGYEVAIGKKGHRAIPLATWELFLLLTEQHPTHRMVSREASPTAESGE